MIETPLRIYSIPQIWDLPDPVWQIEDLIVQRSLFGLYGPSGHGKTFVALHLALCVATGIPFLGRPVVQGSVIYVYAEGAPNLKYRVQAWLKQHGRDPSEANIWFIPTAVDLMDPKEQGLTDLLNTIKAVAPDADLVIIDTLARCFGSANEDVTSDMNTFTNRCAVIRDRLGCTVGVVHHTGHKKSRERGNRAFRSNSDTFIRCSKRSDRDAVITLKCEKQKDAPPFDDLKLRLNVVSIDGGTSCTVSLANTASESRVEISAEIRKQLEALRSFGRDGATFSQWRDAAIQAGISESTFKRNRTNLARDGLVTSPPEDTSRGFTYLLQAAGQSALRLQHLNQKVKRKMPEQDLGSSRVQLQLHKSSDDTIGVTSGSEAFVDPTARLGSNGGAYKAPLAPIAAKVHTASWPTASTNTDPLPCSYCGEHSPLGCGFCGIVEGTAHSGGDECSL